MWEFQIEPLNAEELPFHLLDPLKSVFESSDALLRKAAEFHRDQLAQHLEYVRGLDYSKLLAEGNDWMERFNSRCRIRQRLDPQKYLALARQIERYQRSLMLLNDRFFSLVAIGLFATGSSWDEVVNFLDGQSWAIKHDVLTRWGWIKCHHGLLKDGKKLLAPYSCSLSPHGKTYDQDDEEFHQLLFFLRLLRLATGRELLFVEKGQTPDFKLVETKTGRCIGAEMTEAWTSTAWTNEFIASVQVMRFLGQRLQDIGVPVHVKIETPRSWRSLRKRQAEVADWIISNVIEIGIPIEKGGSLQNLNLKLRIKISPTEQRPSISCGSFASSGPKLFDTSRQSEVMCASLQKRILEKLKTPLPAVNPCFLVIHPVHDLDVDLEQVVAGFFQHSKPDVSSHFSEVWLASVKHAVQLI